MLLLLVIQCIGLVSGAGAVQDSCNGGDGTCAAVADTLTRSKEFWKDMKRRGLQLKMKSGTVQEKAFAGLPARNRTGMKLIDDVFYGRAIMKVPRDALLSLETCQNKDLRRQLTDFLFEEKALEKRFNVTGEDSPHLLSLAYPLISEKRDPTSVFREWLDASHESRVFVLHLTDRQLSVLNGTTVDGAYEEMSKNRNLILETSGNMTFFRDWPMTLEEANWALAVIMRHSRIVHPHQDVRDTRHPRMYIFPIVDLLSVHLHPDPTLAVTFQEEITLEDGKREEEMVLQIARRDMPKGEEVFLWPGRLSNSEMIVRHGMAFPLNPVGIGRNVTEPPNWSKNPDAAIRKEFEKFNCSTLESFELRISPRGYPMKNFVRCYRVSWFISNGWYSPAYVNRQRELNKWPPPEKYSKEDWLSWTQADADVKRAILDYCKLQREMLKDSMDAATAESFRKSSDPADKLLWHLRGEESKSFKECIAVHKKLH